LLEIDTGLAQSENEKKRQIWDVIQTNASRDLILPNTPNKKEFMDNINNQIDTWITEGKKEGTEQTYRQAIDRLHDRFPEKNVAKTYFPLFFSDFQKDINPMDSVDIDLFQQEICNHVLLEIKERPHVDKKLRDSLKGNHTQSELFVLLLFYAAFIAWLFITNCSRLRDGIYETKD